MRNIPLLKWSDAPRPFFEREHASERVEIRTRYGYRDGCEMKFEHRQRHAFAATKVAEIGTSLRNRNWLKRIGAMLLEMVGC